jgi:anthranilate phosphoribosyltransferase
VLGVPDELLVEKLALVLQSLGCQHAMVVHGDDGLDEITVTGKTRVCELKDGRTMSYSVSPEDFGLPRASLDSLRGGTIDGNATQLRNILAGTSGPQRDVVVMNAAAVLLTGDRVKTLQQGINLAEEVIDSGHALTKLERLIEFSQSITQGA